MRARLPLIVIAYPSLGTNGLPLNTPLGRNGLPLNNARQKNNLIYTVSYSASDKRADGGGGLKDRQPSVNC